MAKGHASFLTLRYNQPPRRMHILRVLRAAMHHCLNTDVCLLLLLVFFTFVSWHGLFHQPPVCEAEGGAQPPRCMHKP